tara:strand:- start:6049 stop:6732 length:684 start_codon:yes stop_codon:yes gene_type:complete
MNNILTLILGALILITLYTWFNGNTITRTSGALTKGFGDVTRRITGQVGETIEDVSETAGDVYGAVTGTIGDAVGSVGRTAGKTITGFGDTVGDISDSVGQTVGGIFSRDAKPAKAAVAMQEASIGMHPPASIQDQSQNLPSGPAGTVNIPMAQHNNGYPSAILPGKVGTFHPTNDCDRFICNGCTSCAPHNTGCARMTDDRGRNYPALIDSIRVSRTNEYPFYKIN